MRRTDFALPWGREDPTILALIRNEAEYKTHRQFVHQQSNMVDSSAPESALGGADLFNAGKRVQLRRDRQRDIDHNNMKMVENMAEVMRKGGPTMHGDYQRPYKPGIAASSITRRREQLKIEQQNRVISDRLRNVVKPEIDHHRHAAEYAKATAMRKNISNAAKRAERSAKAVARSRRIAAEALLGSSAGGRLEGEGGGGGGSSDGLKQLVPAASLRSATGLTSVRTAADVRARVAAGRGEEVPEWLTSGRTSLPAGGGKPRAAGGAAPEPQEGRGGNIFDTTAAGRTSGGSGTGKGPPKPLLMMTHMGSGPLPVLTMPPFPMG